MNKYDRVLSIKEYSHKDNSVLDLYTESCKRIPAILKADRYEFNSISRSGKPVIVQKMSKEEQAVLEIIYVGKCMTLEQLLIYHKLKGFNSSISSVKNMIDRFIYYKLVKRVDVTTHISDCDINKEKYYMIGEYTPCKSIGVPNVTMKKLFVLRKECGSNIPLYCISMHVINQMALKQILFNDEVERFVIGDVIFDRNNQLTIPLSVSSATLMVIFTFMAYMDALNTNVLVEKWASYAKQKGKRVELVLITRDDAQQFLVMKEIHKSDFKYIGIGFLNYQDWFNETDDRIIIQTSVNAIMA